MLVKDEVVTTEVLVVGGGIAGLMAAIAAADGGAQVTLADKGNTLRSGSGATGNDHFVCYIPEVHQCTVEEWVEELEMSLVGGWSDHSLQRLYAQKSFEAVQDWNSWGINMRPHGEWEFNGHAFPGRRRIFLKYDGSNQKKVLTRQAKQRGVRILNRVPITDFLTGDDGEIVGAMGLDISRDEPEVVLFRANAIIACTGNTSRLYPSIAPAELFNTAHTPANAGIGRAASYRAGATLVNLDIPNTHAGPKYFERCGKATWIGVIADPSGESLGPFVKTPTKELGDITADVWHSVFDDKMADGTGPVYMNCAGIADEDYDYMMWGLTCEGDTSLIDALAAQGIDVRRQMVEFTRYEPILVGRGIQIDEHAATDVAGLYAAGDEMGNFRNDIGGAAVFGRLAGEDAAARYGGRAVEPLDVRDLARVRENLAFYDRLCSRDEGADWHEFNSAIQQIMNDQAGIKTVRSERFLNVGLTYLDQLEERATSLLAARCSHDLMRTLECFDLLLLGKLVCHSALERKESRGLHKRSDYPFTNPLYNRKFVTIKDEAGVPRTALRSAKD